MSDTTFAASDRLRQIRASFLRLLPERLEQLNAAYGRCGLDGASSSGLEDLLRLLHTLKGASATFGLKSLSALALEGERFAKGSLADPADQTWRRGMEDVLARLRGCDLREEPLQPGPAPVAAPGQPGPEGRLKRVYLCECEPSLRRTMADQIRCFGFEVHPFEDFPSLREALVLHPPDALIMDVSFPGRALADPEVAALAQAGSRSPIPTVFTSSHSDLDLRLASVRAGASAFMVKPLNITELCSALGKLTALEVQDPYRVLIVDDDPPLAEYHAQILQDAGMETRTVNDPLQVMGPLIEMRPDLILMDMYMPGCNGMELAKTIRQIGAHFSIPIVFLSSETDEEKQFHAMRMGGDEFLTKPIKPHHLVTAVAVRAERMKILRAFMVRDSMTGLLNHTATRDQLSSAISHVNRSGGEVCFAMIDVDKFKLVNDTYGHAMGDRVLIALSRLLQQRLRKSDIAGRFGGEEFAVVLPDCDLSRAVSIMNDLRESFSAIRFEAAGTAFSSTFSCGVAALSEYQNTVALCKAADDSLYQAKHGGRNQVIALTGVPGARPV